MNMLDFTLDVVAPWREIPGGVVSRAGRLGVAAGECSGGGDRLHVCPVESQQAVGDAAGAAGIERPRPKMPGDGRRPGEQYGQA